MISKSKQVSSLCLRISVAVLALAATLTHADAFDDAVASTERPPSDHVRDANSQPAATLRFLGTPTAGTIVDLFAGGGYYSEILSRLVGANGQIYMHNNAAYLEFANDSARQRLAGNRLTNVVRYDRELEQIDLAEDSVDMVLMVMTYHDFYYKTDGWDLDPDRFFETAHRILKPGGVLAIIDHVGASGSGKTAAQELHRIDPAFAREDIESRGFKFEAASDLLENPEDGLDLNVFDPGIRGKTSKFVYKFVEPAD